jgi:hypothetical protein
MKKVILIALFGLVVNNQLNAQKDTLKNGVLGFFFFFPIEFPIINNDALNQQLSTLGFPSVSYPVANVGIGMQWHVNQGVITFSFCKTTKKNEQDNSLTKTAYSSFSFNAGYDLLKTKWFSLYPYLGFKSCGLNYYHQEIIPDEVSFDNYFQTDLKYKEITNSRAHLDLGIGFSHQWFYSINFRFGYLLPIEKVRWEMNNSKISLSNFPTINYNYYFSLTIGLGMIMSDRDDIGRRYTNEN